MYGDEDQGEALRSGFQPNEEPPAGVSNFAVGDDEEEDENNEGPDGKANKAAPQYGALDDRNVWNESERS